MSGEGLAKVLAALPPILWAALAAYLVYLLRDVIRGSAGRLTGFEGFGVKVSLGALSALSAAVELAAKHPGWAVEVPEADRRRAIERARQQKALLEGAKIL